MTGSADRIQQLLKQVDTLKAKMLQLANDVRTQAVELHRLRGENERWKRLRDAKAESAQRTERVSAANTEPADAGEHSSHSATDSST